MTIFPCPKRARRGPKAPKRIARSTKPIARRTRARARRETPAAKFIREQDARWAQAIKGTSPNECDLCRGYLMTGAGDAHHVFTRKAHPRLRWDLDNGVHLHRQCHVFAHQFIREFRQWFAAKYPGRREALLSKAARESRLS